MKNNLSLLLLLVNALIFSQESEVLIKSQLPIVKTVYSDAINALFFNKFNKNEIHVFSFDNKYSAIFNGLGSAVLDYDISKNGKYIVTANQDTSIIIWEVKPKKMLLKFNPNQDVLQRIYFYNSNNFFSLGGNGKLKKWNISGQLLYELDVSKSILNAISSFDNKIIIGGYDKTIRIINDRTKKIEQEKHIGEIITSILVNENQKMLYVGDSKGNLYVFDLNLKIINTISLHESVITDMLLFENKYLTTSSWDKTIKLIRVNDYAIQKIFYGHKDYVFSLALRNKELFSSSRDKKIRKWDLEKL